MKTRFAALYAVLFLAIIGQSASPTYAQAPPPTTDPTGSTTGTSTAPPPTTTDPTGSTTTTAAPPPTADPTTPAGANGAGWNLASFEVHEASNALVEVSLPDGVTPTFSTTLIDPTLPGTFIASLLTNDNLDSTLVTGIVTPEGDFLIEMHRASALMLGINSPLLTDSLDREGWSQFWSDYWYYATNPSAMDPAIRYAYYGSITTATVTSTALGAYVVAPYIASTYTSIASAELWTISFTYIPPAVPVLAGYGTATEAIAVTYTLTGAQAVTASAVLATGAVYMTSAVATDGSRYDPLDREIIDAQEEYNIFKSGERVLREMAQEAQRNATTIQDLEAVEEAWRLYYTYTQYVETLYGVFRNLLYAKTGILP